MATPAMLHSFATAGINGWLHWAARASCKALVCDAWAAHVLRMRVRSAASRARCQIYVMLRPDAATKLARRVDGVSVPLRFHGVVCWLRLLCSSLVDYAALARRMRPPVSEQVGSGASHYMAQLKCVSLSASDIARRALPALREVAGHWKLCDSKIHFMDAESDSDPRSEESFCDTEALEELLADVDAFLTLAQAEIEPFVFG